MMAKTSFRSLLHCAGMAGAIAGSLALASAQAAHFTTLYQFTNSGDGESPVGGVVRDSAGLLYGTTSEGGAASCHINCSNFGTIFSFSATAGLKTLAYFTGPNGSYPMNTLLLSGTTLYGNTYSGGANDKGVIFSVHTDGTGYTLLHQFSGADGQTPTGTPRLGAGGVLYGITYAGGAFGDGVLFSLAPDGTYTILHAFTGGFDGDNPTSLLILPTGKLVGSTFQGGNSTCSPPSGCGVVFNYSPATGAFGIEHTFTTTELANPLLGSIGPGPTIYGTTSGSVEIGNPENIVFAIGPSGFETVATLTDNNAGGQYPGPSLAPGGSLVLTIGPGRYAGEGELLDIKGGKIAAGLGFSGGSMGGYPGGQPLVTSKGLVFGTTGQGGACSGCGTIYEVTQ